ncbi:arsenate reductase ArsC [Mesorhizobium sp. GbtcB19]|uniref:arsenate reductase ArsC n=1 Tax=Mesorhizobium sp. GbtcB19 TaxID=2824764 RepID=UPI001C3105B8|nr:arsenate reductase ArsC [Mesorhizobium sp. GbtcB19]
MAGHVYNVLFLCNANSARSIMGEAILNRLGAGRFKAYSAGANPKGTVNPYALQLLESLNYDTSFARSKGWDEFSGPDAPEMNFVFTLCDSTANESCPIWPGHPMTALWAVPDPSKATGNDAEQHFAFADAYRMMSNRIGLFTNLPIHSLDQMALQQHLEEIGRDQARAS